MDEQNKFTQAAKDLGKGYLSNQYAGAGYQLEAALENDKSRKKEIDVLQLEKGVGAAAVGQQERVVVQDDDNPNSKEGEKKKKRERDLQNLIRQQIIQAQLQAFREYTADMYRLAAYYRDQAAKEQDAITNNIDRMQENSRFIGVAEKLIGQYDKTGKLDRETALSELRKRGLNVDENCSAVKLYDELKKYRNKADQANKDLETENEVHQNKYSEHVKNLEIIEPALKAIKEIENDKSLTDEQKVEKIKLIQDELPAEIKREIEKIRSEPKTGNDFEAKRDNAITVDANASQDDFAAIAGEDLSPRFNDAASGATKTPDKTLQNDVAVIKPLQPAGMG